MHSGSRAGPSSPSIDELADAHDRPDSRDVYRTGADVRLGQVGIFNAHHEERTQPAASWLIRAVVVFDAPASGMIGKAPRCGIFRSCFQRRSEARAKRLMRPSCAMRIAPLLAYQQ